MTDRLRLYNDALLLCGTRGLASLSEDTESRRLLDQVWDSNGVNKCLEQGQWFFAMRTVRLDPDPSIEPDFGYRIAYTKPSDWVLTSALCSDEYFRSPLLTYVDEAGYWYSDTDPIYVRYVSNDEDYGMDMNKWPDSFEEFVACYFASKVIWKITTDEKKVVLIESKLKRLKLEAKSRSAMADPTHIPAVGRWARARLRDSRGDRGNLSGNLIG